MRLNVFPNPVRKTFYLDYAALNIHSLQLTDVTGKMVKTYPPSKQELEVNDLPRGTYLLHVKADKGNTTVKIILE
ncbi:MAG TPA: T9SS type A sorting domain-containing protein [Flavipsychrobacter sp.]|nr:T9SS type A sorting domain-containing protein [Flavipsychrobacter sp.]